MSILTSETAQEEIKKLQGWLYLFMEALTDNGIKFPQNTFTEITEYLQEANK